ncbi:alpha/beta fold hydrolase [Microbacterium sp. MEC084]|uniref:alpha/beta fold hydrolase n=1 Tax=Microbacterium sp. MEC084 TaxID=1963027 RepID=UPI001E604A24|nr:alpha/beta hydrolase [Microbacterium sp. MEC084]MCD1269524.1 alpha/beta fold hydrolase [Microbacterium sp. MEC084]
MAVQVVLVHGIRTSATMWRAQVAHLEGRGVSAHAIDLPGHGTRMSETFTLEGAFSAIDAAVRSAAAAGPVLLVGHSMGGLLATEYVGAEDPPPVAGLVAVSSTSIPRGLGLRAYRTLMGGFNALPGRGVVFTKAMLHATLPDETRRDFGAGGYAFGAQDAALRSLSVLDLMAALRRIRVPVWFVNGQWDQLRLHERRFAAAVPGAELIVVPRTTHLVTAMRPDVFNAVLDLAIAVIESRERREDAR